ncbi:ABC transporter substrate-binding protein [Caldimonas sp. KR1-144]|uniref:ABC transporter substrate-binding protein n=1 Tax=Caldimonas sp. KR1-144 TaxID=3400911 RepID=UPI003C0C7DC0
MTLMRSKPFDRARRRLMAAPVAAATLALPLAATAQPRGARPLRIAQLLDVSADQQDLSRDYATGVRLAVAELNQAGRPWQLVTLESDGSAASLAQAVKRLRDDADIAMLVGTAGERLALASAAALRQEGLAIAQVGPWVADNTLDGDDTVFPLFASREVQLRRVLQDLGSMGVRELGVVYASPRERSALGAGVEALAARLSLRTIPLAAPVGADLAAWGASLAATSPVLQLFLGGAPELARFTQGLAQAGRQRYVVGLADVDMTTLLQIGPGKSVPLILTQVVPNPQSSALPVVRGYRALLKQLFDEAPSPMSLAGYLAARYAAQAIGRFETPPSRAQALAELQRRPNADLGGFAISFGSGQRRGSQFVAQTMLTADGRLVG